MIKKNNNPKYFISLLFIFFGIFVAYLLYPSQLSLVNKELKVASGVADVKNVWDKHANEFALNPDFYEKIVSKLSDLRLGDAQVESVFSWLPDRRPTHLNLVVVPDLSARITQENNNPDQIKTDKVLLSKIWSTFSDKYNSQIDSKSKFLLTVTDDEQVRGDFYKIASGLSVDLENKKENIRVRDMLKDVDGSFKINLDKIYSVAKEKTSGADYWYFFDRKLANYFKKPTLTDKYENKLIILTDGYLELTDGKVYTQNTAGLGAKIKDGMDKDLAFKLYGTTITPTSYKNLDKWGVMLLEINERKSGVGSDFVVLKKYWEDWFKTMGGNSFDSGNLFIQHDNTTQVAEDKIKDFLK